MAGRCADDCGMRRTRPADEHHQNRPCSFGRHGNRVHQRADGTGYQPCRNQEGNAGSGKGTEQDS